MPSNNDTYYYVIPDGFLMKYGNKTKNLESNISDIISSSESRIGEMEYNANKHINYVPLICEESDIDHLVKKMYEAKLGKNILVGCFVLKLNIQDARSKQMDDALSKQMIDGHLIKTGALFYNTNDKIFD